MSTLEADCPDVQAGLDLVAERGGSSWWRFRHAASLARAAGSSKKHDEEWHALRGRPKGLTDHEAEEIVALMISAVARDHPQWLAQSQAEFPTIRHIASRIVPMIRMCDHKLDTAAVDEGTALIALE
jgi:hypothetical protein